MSTRSGKRIHSEIETVENSEDVPKLERRIRRKTVKENIDETTVVPNKSKKRKNYVSFPVDSTDGVVKDLGDQVVNRRETLKELATNVPAIEEEIEKKPVRVTRRTKKFEDPEIEAVPEIAETRSKKGKKSIKKKAKISVEAVIVTEPDAGDVVQNETKSSKRKKKRVKRSKSFIVEDVNTESNTNALSNNLQVSSEQTETSEKSNTTSQPVDAIPSSNDSSNTSIDKVNKKKLSKSSCYNLSLDKVEPKLNSTFEKNEETLNSTFEQKETKINSAFEQKETKLNSTFEKKEQERNSSLENKDSRLNSTFEKQERKRNSSLENKDSRLNLTFEKQERKRNSLENKDSRLNSTFEKQERKRNSSLENKDSRLNSTFEKQERKRNSPLEKKDTKHDSTFEKKKQKLDLTFEKKNQTDSTYEIKEATFDKTDSVLNSTFDKKESISDCLQDKPETQILQSDSKSSLIRSDEDTVNVTFDKSEESSFFSIKSDNSKVEYIINTTPVLIESSMEESKLSNTGNSIIDISEDPKVEELKAPQTPLKREGTFTKDGPEISTPQRKTPLKRISEPSPGRTPFHSGMKNGVREKSFALNLTRSIEKRRSSLVEPARTTRVMFCSPVNDPSVATQRKSKIIKSNLKGSSKSFVFDESVSESIRPARRKRSYTLGDADDASAKRKRLGDDMQQSVDRLSRPRTCSATSKLAEPTTPSKKPGTPKKPKSENKVSRAKLPNFSALHQRRFEKMESLDECQERKAKRAKQLLVPTGSLTVLERSSPKGTLTEAVKTVTKKAETEVKPKPAYTRFGFKLNLDVNPFSITNKNTTLPPNENKPNGVLKREATLPSLAGATSVRKEAAKQTIMREKSFSSVSEKRDAKRNENRTIIKGVRTNRRFELQMKSRNING